MYIYHHCLAYQLHDAVQQVTTDSQAIADWARSHGLMINFTKTTAMIWGSNDKLKQLQSLEVPPILVDYPVIPYVNSTKCLGLIIDQNLSWNSHILQTTRIHLKYKLLLSSDKMIDKTWINVVEVENEIGKHIFGNIYRSPNSNIKAFCDKFIDYASKIGDVGKLVLVGDFNIDDTHR
ncbi:Protein of unknown function [Cotesia congregata]|uniref:Uncharacterized protein n=1 Tax=Cotesia congregata TaxID=51543 RepID=A0A8J2MI42_COTCN|nr:Protein of unknown function [Cotesia congregata]